MHDQSCQVPSAACHTEKSTGCWFGVPSAPRSGCPAICQGAPSINGTSTGGAPAVPPDPPDPADPAAPPVPPDPVALAPLDVALAVLDDAPPAPALAPAPPVPPP